MPRTLNRASAYAAGAANSTVPRAVAVTSPTVFTSATPKLLSCQASAKLPHRQVWGSDSGLLKISLVVFSEASRIQRTTKMLNPAMIQVAARTAVVTVLPMRAGKVREGREREERVRAGSRGVTAVDLTVPPTHGGRRG